MAKERLGEVLEWLRRGGVLERQCCNKEQRGGEMAKERLGEVLWSGREAWLGRGGGRCVGKAEL